MPVHSEEELKAWLPFYNREARVEHEGKIFAFSEEDIKYLNRPGNYWNSKTDPSSWLCTSTVGYARSKWDKELPREKLIALCAALLNNSPESLESTLDWNANYMAWHDGGSPEENHVYPK